MSNPTATGSCLFGQVSYAISDNLGIFQYCHWAFSMDIRGRISRQLYSQRNKTFCYCFL